MEKSTFIEELKARIKKWVVEVLNFCESLPNNQVTRVINFQLIKSATSTGANQRAASRGRSKAEFYSKLCIAVEEADESQYWLELIDAKGVQCDKEKLKALSKEISEIVAILTAARNTASKFKK